MHLTDLALRDFRSHADTVVRLAPGVTTFVGRNGQGKTNLVEAVAYLATLASHRATTTAPLVRQGAASANIRAKLVRGERAALIALELVPGKSSRAHLGKAKVKPTALLGLAKAVAFAPEDLALVKGGPELRRRYLDELLVQMRPALAGVMADWERVNHQRAALLKSLAPLRGEERERVGQELVYWQEEAARLGGRLTANRMALADDLAPLVAASYGRVAGEGWVDVDYEPTVAVTGRPEADQVAEALLRAMRAGQTREIERGASLFGPHREDLALTLNGLPAKGYASHGESWSLALALKLGAFELMRRDADDDPILILDDVFAELDADRREGLAKLVDGVEQVLVTAAVRGDVPEGLTGRWYRVAEGRVE
ncbi:MAG: DNA replication/repair protein RecF, partial [Bifidobacteriaceae bacterium]|nr:DNA replication/repair protein RecF [Bifidobacteriaceae bacterium]